MKLPVVISKRMMSCGSRLSSTVFTRATQHEDVVARDATIVELKKNLVELEHDRLGMERDLVERNKRIDELTKEVATCTDVYEALANEVAEREGDLKVATASVESATKEREDRDQTIKKLEARVGALKRELTFAKEDVVVLEEDHRVLVKQVEDGERSLSDKESLLEHKAELLQEAQQEIEKLRAAYAQKEADRERMINERTQLLEEHMTQRVEAKTLLAKELDAARAEWKEERAVLKEKVKALRKKKDNLESVIRAHVREAQKLGTENARLTESFHAVQRQETEAREQCEAAKDELSIVSGLYAAGEASRRETPTGSRTGGATPALTGSPKTRVPLATAEPRGSPFSRFAIADSPGESDAATDTMVKKHDYIPRAESELNIGGPKPRGKELYMPVHISGTGGNKVYAGPVQVPIKRTSSILVGDTPFGQSTSDSPEVRREGAGAGEEHHRIHRRSSGKEPGTASPRIGHTVVRTRKRRRRVERTGAGPKPPA